MKILVALKRVVDHNIKVNIKPDGSALALEGLKTSVNPFDENALEEAVRLKEAGKADEIVAVTLGSKENEAILRHAFAMGADRALLVETDAELQSLAVAKLLQSIVEREQPELILLGKQAIDDDAGQAGQMLAGLLGYPQATFASTIEIAHEKAQVTREINGGTETLSIDLPAVITTDLRLNEPRFIKLPNLMRARQKKIETIAAESLNVNLTPRLNAIQFNEPPARKPGVKVNDINELLNRLRDEEGITL